MATVEKEVVATKPAAKMTTDDKILMWFDYHENHDWKSLVAHYGAMPENEGMNPKQVATKLKGFASKVWVRGEEDGGAGPDTPDEVVAQRTVRDVRSLRIILAVGSRGIGDVLGSNPCEEV